MMTKLLSDPSGYTGGDISEMLFAGMQIGAVGSAAPDPSAADTLAAMFLDTLGKKLDADIAKGDKVDGILIYWAASQAGFTDLAAKADKFVF